MRVTKNENFDSIIWNMGMGLILKSQIPIFFWLDGSKNSNEHKA